jgi:hypothetical protein
MLRRLVATIALWAVFLTPIASLWCAYTCAADDDSASAVVSAAAASASPSEEAVAAQVAFAAHDDCAADLSNTAILAVLQGRVRHAVSLVASSLTTPVPRSLVPAAATHSAWLALSRGSPPGARFYCALRI